MAKKAKAEKSQNTATFGNALEVREDSEEVVNLNSDPGDELEEEPEEGGEEEETETEGDSQEEDSEEEESESDEEPEEESESEEESDEEAESKPKAKAKGKEESSEDDSTEGKQVPLQALIAERKKAKDRIASLEEENRRLRGETGLGQSDTTGEDASQGIVKELSEKFDNRLAAQSFKSARRFHSDYEEKAQAVADAAKVNPSILDMIDSDEDPGEATYQFGEEILYQKKYGKTRKEQHESLTKEITTQLETKIRKAVESELMAKLQKKKKAPTNISTARASGGNDEAPYRGMSFGRRLSR